MNNTDKFIAGLCILRGKISYASFYNSSEGALFKLNEEIGPDTEQILEGYGWRFTNNGAAVYFDSGGDW
jgi:hypothetical protein